MARRAALQMSVAERWLPWRARELCGALLAQLSVRSRGGAQRAGRGPAKEPGRFKVSHDGFVPTNHRQPWSVGFSHALASDP